MTRLQTTYGFTAGRARELLEEYWRACACEEEAEGAALMPAPNGEEQHD